MAQHSRKETVVSPKQTMEIMSNMLHESMKNDPLLWVMYAFPWGQKGTPLENFPNGPKEWQKDELKKVAEFCRNNCALVEMGLSPKVYKSATVSGRGPGKSALVAWLVLWHISTHLGACSIISANTETQLTTRTFGEIGKWQTLCLSGYWFDRGVARLAPQPWFAKQLKEGLKIDSQYYYANGFLWNEDNPDAFAGVHNQYGTMVLFDEASGIPQPIWTVSEGFFTDSTIYRFWFVFSNPRKNTGPFFECFHAHRHYWNTRRIDSRDVEGPGVDHAWLNEQVEKYGEDSDEARIEVKGEFPRQGDRQFINRQVVEDARSRQLERYDDHAALCMGVDPARYGDDSTVIRFRRGRDARSIPAIKMKGADNMAVANKCAELIDKFDPDAVFIDAGSGAGIIDRLKELGYKVHEVGFGTASGSEEYADHRTELWAKMRDWLGGAMIDKDPDLFDDLCGPEYEYFGREDKLKLEAKEKMKKRGLSSPDDADALAVTFHLKVARLDLKTGLRGPNGRRNTKAKGMDYKIFS